VTDLAQPMGAGLNAVLISTDLSRTSDKPPPACSRRRPPLQCEALFDACGVLSRLCNCGPEAHELACEVTTREVRKLENDLVEKGSLVGLTYEFIVRKDEIWPELQSVVHDKQVE